ncbi:MAG TPA: histidine phosphatase family protein [Candidatus Krumholzibacterium sp.]|nr:histidine phosphatase family protein [Candidatus Krumholzibacterium sp.]
MDAALETTIYLVRHAEPLPPHVDSRRPLSDGGRKDIAAVAREIAGRIDGRPSRIIHSGKLRAMQTAAILDEELHPPFGVEEGAGLMPGDDTDPWRDGLETVEEDLMIVGHMPFLADLRQSMTGGGYAALKTSEVVCLQASGGRWVERWTLSPGDAGI